MKIKVEVKAGAKENRVEKLASGQYRVKVKAPPKEGKANDSVIALLAEYFHVPQSRITIKLGQFTKSKILVID